MRKPKNPVDQNARREDTALQPSHPQLQLQPVSFDPPRWAERAKLQAQWREFDSPDRLRRLH